VSCFSAPVPYAESLRKLAELKNKLVELEATLEDFDNKLEIASRNQLAYRELSPEDQAVLDSHKSLQDVIQGALAKGSHSDADEDPEVPGADVEEERRELSPEDEALLAKYPSLHDLIDSEMNKPSHSDTDEDAEVPGANEEEQEEERRDAAHIYRQLSAEDQALIDKYKSMKEVIASVLAKASHSDADEDSEIPESEQEEGGEKEERVLRRGNSNVFTYIAQLPSEDQDLLRRMRSKVPNLQLALDRMQKRHNQVEEAAHESAEAQTVFRRGNSNVFTYMSQLSDADQQLLRKMRSKIPYLQLALDKKSRRNNPAYKRAEELEESLVSDNEEDDKLKQFEQSLSPDDLALLKAMKSKLHFLKEALHAHKHPAEEEESASQSEAEDVPGADAGPMEDRQEAKMDGWNEQPLSDHNLGLEESDLQDRCPCQKHEGSGKRCACDKEFQERCPNCHDQDVIVKLLAERCPTCHHDKTPDAVVEEVETRLMNDVAFAKANGVSINELIERIKTKVAEKVLNEERELEMLATE